MQHPVRTQLQSGHARHPRHPLPLPHLTRLTSQMQTTITLVTAQHLRRAVTRPVVSRNNDIDTPLQVITHLRIDDVDLVAH